MTVEQHTAGCFDHLLPSELKCFYFGFKWDSRKVWTLPVTSEMIARAELNWHLSLPFWSVEPHKIQFNLSPLEVLRNPEAHPEHFARILQADLRYPIDTMWNVDRFIILDGMHRLARAYRESIEQVSWRRIPREHIPEIMVPYVSEA
jgi:hypothetical protein